MDTGVALEAILLASFILMRQSGLAKRADEREHLMLQTLLLTEKQVSAAVQMNRNCRTPWTYEHFEGRRYQELRRPSSVDEVGESIQENLSKE